MDKQDMHHKVGERVQLHPATDAWMRGDKYGEIVKVGRAYYHVKMDVSGRTLKVTPRNIMGRIVWEPQAGWAI